MNIAALKTPIYAWIVGSVGVANVTVYWDEPNAPRPLSPSVRLKLISGPRMLGQDDVLPDDASPGAFRVSGPRPFTLSVNAYGNQSLQIITNLQSSVSRPAPMEALNAANLAVVDAGPARDLTVALETKYEQRTQMDVEMLASEDFLVEQDVIEHVEVSSDIGGIESEIEVDA